MSGSGTVAALGISATLALSLGCGQTDTRSGSAGGSAGRDSNAGGDAGAIGGAANAAGGAANAAGGAANAADNGITLDTSDCVARPLGDCEGIQSQYESNAAFNGTPALAPCSSFNSFDGCGTLIFGFDARGCAISIAPGPAGWQTSAHLSELQHCLTDTFADARWPCLASSSVRYDESCFIR